FPIAFKKQRKLAKVCSKRKGGSQWSRLSNCIICRQLHARATENGDRAAVLRPAGNIVANGNRAFLTVGDRFHALCRNTTRSEVILGGGRTASTESEVIFARTAFV